MKTHDERSPNRELRVVVSFVLPEELLRQVRNVSPGISISQNDDEKELTKMIKEADVLFAGHFSPRMFRAAKNLKWIQAQYVGVDEFLFPEVVKSDVIVTNASGVNTISVAEHVIGLMLCLNRKLHRFIRDQTKRKWKNSNLELVSQIEELSEKTVGIVGLGKIGEQIAKRAKSFGMYVIATRRDVTLPTPEYVEKLVPLERLAELLAESDFVVIQLPLTKGTEGIIGEKELRSMKDSAYLINASRGRIVKEDQLVRALEEGWIAGAGLDTFAEEPLPRDSLLWNLENVVITPHVAGLTPHYAERLMTIFCENLRRYLNHEDLVNVIDKERGY